MGFIEYTDNNKIAIIYNEYREIIAYAFQDVLDTHWEIDLRVCPFKEAILRALDAHAYFY